jgi:acyl-CoA synthetase (AMP-forming)/AMP-acid ligase II
VDELTYLINYSEARILFVGPDLVEAVTQARPKLTNVKEFVSLEGAAPDMLSLSDILADHTAEEPDNAVRAEDPYLLFFTSGTTGVPRGALYTQWRKLDNTRIKALEIGVEPGDKHLMILPLFHIGGDSHVWPFFLVGGCNVIVPHKSFDPLLVLKTIQDEKATDMHIVPTQLVAMLNRPEFHDFDLSSLKRIWTAASPMPVSLLRKGLEIFGPIFMQGYGQTESGPEITFFHKNVIKNLSGPLEDQKVLASAGQPSIGIHLRIVDEKGQDLPPFETGEVIMQSESTMVEYWRKPEETKETIVEGWLHTGDLGYYDDQGFIYLVDRKKDMIVTGGENVYPREVEEVLYTHPAVSEAAVIGIPDEVWVERVHAEIILKEGHTVTEEEIIEYCKERMARYKTPKSVKFVDSLPMNPQGKILKKELKRMYR